MKVHTDNETVIKEGKIRDLEEEGRKSFNPLEGFDDVLWKKEYDLNIATNISKLENDEDYCFEEQIVTEIANIVNSICTKSFLLKLRKFFNIKIFYDLFNNRVAIMKNLPAKMVVRGQVFDVILWLFLCRDSFLKHLHSLQTPSVRFLLCGTQSVASCL